MSFFFHLKECLTDAEYHWNNNDLQDFKTITTKIMHHEENFEEFFEDVIKFNKSIGAIYDLVKT